MTGNIWDASADVAIVIPTNVGWKHNGENVMGRGVARQAATRYWALAEGYGYWCKAEGDRLYERVEGDGRRLICFPVKPLALNPSMSWQQPADLHLLERSAVALAALSHRSVWLPLVGCGNGGLNPADVLPILERLLDDRFTLVELSRAGKPAP